MRSMSRLLLSAVLALAAVGPALAEDYLFIEPSPEATLGLLPPATPLEPPYNGEVNYYTGGEAIAPLQISTQGSQHYLVKLVDAYSGQMAMTVFVRGGESIEVRVPLGAYVFKYASGIDWFGYTDLFGPNTAYSKADSTFEFAVDGDRITGHAVTLFPVENGNLSTSQIGAMDF